MVLEVCGAQLAPPSVVARIVPFDPTAQPRCASTNATDKSLSVVLEVWGAQLVPPSAVARIVPLHPTAQPRC